MYRFRERKRLDELRFVVKLAMCFSLIDFRARTATLNLGIWFFKTCNASRLAMEMWS